MIKLRKKTLSVLLCLTLLASVIVVGFAMPATAEEVVAPSTDYAKIDFEDKTDSNLYSPNDTKATGAIANDDDDHGNYMKVTAPTTEEYTYNTTAYYAPQNAMNTCKTLNDLRFLNLGKKYYISFDAKYDGNATDFRLAMGTTVNNYAWPLGETYYRSATFNSADAMANSGSVYYIDGDKKESFADFNDPSDEWQHFGFTLNLDESVWNSSTTTYTYINYGNSVYTGIWKDGLVYLYFGATEAGATMCFDNIVIYEIDEYADAVPTIEYSGEETTVTEFETDVEGITDSDVWVYGTFGTNVGTEDLSGSQYAVESAHGKTIKFIDNSYTRYFAFKNAAVFDTIGAKYKVTFDVKSTQSSNVNFVLKLGNNKNISGWNTNAFSIAGTSGVTQAAIDNGFKFYIDGSEVAPADFKIQASSLGWHTYSIEFTYTDALYDSGVAATTDPRNLWIVAIRGYLDNYKVEVTKTVEGAPDTAETMISNRDHKNEPFVSAGLRFMNSLPDAVADAADEIGFVVAPSTLAAQADCKDNWYNLDGDLNSIARKAVCKDADNDINIVYNEEDGRTYYQLVLTGLSTENEEKTAYSRRFSVVMYTKTNGVYKYSALGEYSYNQVEGIEYVLGKN